MTSQGSEQIAVQALEVGAASYVPKRTLNQDLLDTVQRVLDVSVRERGHQRFLQCMTHNECQFELESDISLIPLLVSYLRDAVAPLELCGETERIRLAIALEEALNNALYHGNLEIGSELREKDSDAYYALIEQRKQESPYRDRHIFVHAKFSRAQAEFTIRDEGPGFHPHKLPDPTAPANLEQVSGRGVLLMRTFMDEVLYTDQGNQVTLVKQRSSRS